MFRLAAGVSTRSLRAMDEPPFPVIERIRNLQFLPNRGMDIEYGQSAMPAHQIAYRVKSIYSTRTIGYMCLYLRSSALAGMLGDISENIRGLALVDSRDTAIPAAAHSLRRN